MPGTDRGKRGAKEDTKDERKRREQRGKAEEESVNLWWKNRQGNKTREKKEGERIVERKRK